MEGVNGVGKREDSEVSVGERVGERSNGGRNEMKEEKRREWRDQKSRELIG